MKKEETEMKYDVLVVGGGLAGMRATLASLRDGVKNTAIISKEHPLRAHSKAAQGGINAVLYTDKGDSIEAHIFDTVKGSDYLADQNVVEILCREAPEDIWELDRMGVVFSRTPKGKIAQRLSGGTSICAGASESRIAQRNFGGQSCPRTIYKSDKTGHVLVEVLYEQITKKKVKILPEWHVLSLIIEDGKCRGVVAYDMHSGEIKIIRAKAVVLATGGYGRAYKITSNAHANTGDMLVLVLKAGIPLEDMEFVQFHPTGLPPDGALATEGARGEGGYLINKDGERFMKRYAPEKMELGPRDLVSRAIQTEINEGRGIDGYVLIDLTHLGEKIIQERLPQIRGLIKNFTGIDCVKKPFPIRPTAHYSMGGIPTDADGKVLGVDGLYAAGECSCISLHGANRLGGNSLMETIVFGRRAGKSAAEYAKQNEFLPVPKDALMSVEREINAIIDNFGKERVANLRSELQETMTNHCGIFRNENGLKFALETIKDLKKRFFYISIDDKGSIFNTDLMAALELKNLLTFSEVIVAGALARKESRGSHFRTDYSERDDVNFLKHTMAYLIDEKVLLEYKPVTITKYQPKRRVY